MQLFFQKSKKKHFSGNLRKAEHYDKNILKNGNIIKLGENNPQLVKMMKLIGNEMLKNPSIAPRDLETWGFVVTEYTSKNTVFAA